MTRAACFLLLFATLLAADDKKPDPKAELATLKGKWKITTASFDGRDTPKVVGRVLQFDDKQVTAFDGDKKGGVLDITIDPGANPKHINLAVPNTDKKAAGLYAIDGDKLTLCYGEPGADRPKKAESKAGGKAFLLVLERVKP